MTSIYQQTHTPGLPSRYAAAQQGLTVSALETGQLEHVAAGLRADAEQTSEWRHEVWEIEHQRYRDLLHQVTTAKPGTRLHAAAEQALERCEEAYSQGQKHWSPERRAWEHAYGMAAYEHDVAAGRDYASMAGTPQHGEEAAHLVMER